MFKQIILSAFVIIKGALVEMLITTVIKIGIIILITTLSMVLIKMLMPILIKMLLVIPTEGLIVANQYTLYLRRNNAFSTNCARHSRRSAKANCARRPCN